MKTLVTFALIGVLLVAAIPLTAMLPDASAAQAGKHGANAAMSSVIAHLHANGYALIGGNGLQNATINLHGPAHHTAGKRILIPTFDGTINIAGKVYDVTSKGVIRLASGGNEMNVLVIHGKVSDGSEHNLLLRFIVGPGNNGTHIIVGNPAGRIGAGIKLVDMTGKIALNGSSSGGGGGGGGSVPSLDHFALSSVGNQTAGQQFTFTVTAVSTNGTVFDGYNGTVTVNTNDGNSPAGNASSFSPETYTFVPGTDHGSHAFSVTMYNAMNGVYLNASGSGKAGGSNVFAVVHGNLANVRVSPPSITLAPNATEVFAASAFDSFGNQMTGTAFVWSQSTGAIGTLSPGNSSMFESLHASVSTTGANGTVVAKANGTGISGSSAVTVSSNSVHLDHFAVSFIRSNQTAGQPFNFTVVAVDNLGGIMTGFNGRVNLTGTDGSSPLGNASMFSPQSYVYQNSDAGRHVFFATMFKAMRGATVTATGAGKTGTSNPFNVVPGAITKVTISPSNITMTANATVIATANATDAYGNPVNSGFEWSISPTSGVATVTPTANTHSAAIRGANVSTVTTGTLTVKASGTSVSATAPVKVNP